jgi:DNA (cytosine-5)-methyltransferase 1
MILLDLFSGYGGFHKGLEEAGFKFSKTYFSEIDKNAIANYKYNFPDAEYVGSVESISGIERPNIITFGSPCQDFSLAGKRAGMEGERSSLILEAIKLITRYKPDFFIWENVKGTFSSNDGEDFWAILQSFANIGNYRLEWQLCNTVWFLPQNRERIYLVGSLGKGSGGEIFPIGESNGLLEASRQEGEIKGEYCTTITKNCHKGVYNQGETLIGVVQKDYTKGNSQGARVYDIDGVAVSQSALGGGGGAKTGLYEVGSRIRRLTPTETERLQGLPDGWTKYGNYNGEVKEIADTNRYKLCGNGVSVPVVKAIGEKIIKSKNRNTSLPG